MTFPRIGGERDGDRRNLNNMIFLSLLLHTLALSVVLFSSPTLPSPRWTFGPVYEVQMVSFSKDLFKEKAASAVSREIMETDLRERPVIFKKRIETGATGLTRSIEIQKKQTSSSESTNIRQKILSLSNPRDRTAPPVAAESTVTSSTQQGDAELSMKMKAYYTIIWERIKGQWALPPHILSEKNVETVIHLRVLRNGAVTDVNFEKRSGNRYFDDSTMKAIGKASPFPPLPEQIRGDSIELGIRFHSSQMR